MTTQTEALTLALEALQEPLGFTGSREIDAKLKEAITAIKEALAQPEQEPWGACVSGRVFVGNLPDYVRVIAEDEGLPIQWLYTTPPQPEQERCVGCEACIDTACGRDECPKGWPKAVQPEQEPVEWGVDWGKDGNSVSIIKRLADGNIEVLAWEYSPHPPQPKEPEQEPVAWAMLHDNGDFIDAINQEEHARIEGDYKHALYTTPPQRTWVGLTDDDLRQIILVAVGVAEAKLKEKNT